MYTPLIKEFNDYAIEKGIDIRINMELLTSNNSTIQPDAYASAIDLLLKRKSDKYDIFFFDNVDTVRYSPYFIDLKDYLKEEHIAMYPEALKSEAFSYNNKLVGLVIYIKIYFIYFFHKYKY